MMNRGREFNPSLFEDQKILSLTRDARWTYQGVRCYADDYGRGLFNELKMWVAIYSEEEQYPLGFDEFEAHLLELMESGLIEVYTIDGREYFWIPSFEEDAKVRTPTRSRYPEPPPKPILARPQNRCAASVSDADSDAEQREGREGEEWEREPGREPGRPGGSVPERARERTGEAAPDPFCPRHPGGTDKPCKPCGNARLAFRKWEADQMSERYEEGSSGE